MAIMTIENKAKGEFPINWHVNSFPKDARLILWMRSKVGEHLQEHPVDNPVADLTAEQVLLDTDLTFRVMHQRVNQPITFVLPTGVLRFLSRL